MIERATARAWAEINLDHLVHNYRQAQRKTRGRPAMCVVKADAYGHGAPRAAAALEAAGVERFAVATVEEALQLRRHGVKADILLLGTPDAVSVPELHAHGVTLTVNSPEAAESYALVLNGKKQKIHVKVDTGMTRQGLSAPNLADQVLAIAGRSCFETEGLYTHFAAADDPEEDAFTERQCRTVLDLAEQVRDRGLHIPLIHCANSAGIIAHPASHADMTRPGIMLYGSNPRPAVPMDLRQPLSLHARVVQVRNVRAGESVGYGRAWIAPRDARVAVLPVGYADGLPRGLSGKLSVLLKGKRAPQVGRICMDMCMADVTDIPDVNRGDAATLIGRQGHNKITADEVADLAGTISYEIFCAVGRRLPRVYRRKEGGDEAECYVDCL